jgi:hypothetical protein
VTLLDRPCIDWNFEVTIKDASESGSRLRGVSIVSREEAQKVIDKTQEMPSMLGPPRPAFMDEARSILNKKATDAFGPQACGFERADW